MDASVILASLAIVAIFALAVVIHKLEGARKTKNTVVDIGHNLN